MSTLSDALTALKNVVLMQERLDVMGKNLDRQATDLKGLKDHVSDIDKRLVRIETMVEVSARNSAPPRIEG